MVPESSILDLAVDSAHPGVVYAASENSGVYLSTNGGGTWTAINEGLLEIVQAFSLALSTDGERTLPGNERRRRFSAGNTSHLSQFKLNPSLSRPQPRQLLLLTFRLMVQQTTGQTKKCWKAIRLEMEKPIS